MAVRESWRSVKGLKEDWFYRGDRKAGVCVLPFKPKVIVLQQIPVDAYCGPRVVLDEMRSAMNKSQLLVLTEKEGSIQGRKLNP